MKINYFELKAHVHCLVVISRREAAQAKNEAESQGDVVQALRRDLAGAAARMSDMAGELSDKQKQKLEQYEERIRDQDTELDGQRKQLVQLSALVDEQQKEINSREDKLDEQQKVRKARTLIPALPLNLAVFPNTNQSERWKIKWKISLL